MPLAMVGPMELIGAAVGRDVVHRVVWVRGVVFATGCWPSLVATACSEPSEPATKTTPGIIVAAAEFETRACSGSGNFVLPDFFAGGQFQRDDAAALQPVVDVFIVRTAAPHDSIELREEGILLARGHVDDLRFPDLGAFVIRIDREHAAVFRAEDDDRLAVGKRFQDRRIADVLVGAVHRQGNCPCAWGRCIRRRTRHSP